MNLKTLNITVLLIGLILTSCVKNIDFEQAEDYETETQYISSLVYFKMPVVSFLDEFDNELSTPIQDESTVTIFQQSFIQDYLVEAEFEFEIDNPFSRDILVDLEFLDADDNITYNFASILIPANTNNYLPQKETVVISEHPNFLRTRKVRASVQLQTNSGSQIDINNTSEFEFKSAGTFTFKI